MPESASIGEPVPEKAWYVAFVLTGSEVTVSRRMASSVAGLEILVPRRSLRERVRGQWHDVEKTVFPGYVFFQSELTNEQHFIISHLTGVIRILEQNRQPQPVSLAEMDLILRLTDREGLIGFSRVSQEAGKVVVSSGPLLGCEGMIIGADRRKGRVRIRLTVNGQNHHFDVGAEWIS